MASTNGTAETDFFATAATPFAVLDGEGRVTRANLALRRAVAIDGAVDGEPFENLVRPGDKARVAAALRGLEATASVSFDARFATADETAGEPHRFHASREGGAVRVVGVPAPASPATDALEVEGENDERGESQGAALQMFSRVLDTAAVVLWSVDANGVYTMSEGKGLELMGFRPGESVGLNAFEMYQGHPEMVRALRQAMAGEDARLVTGVAPGVHFETWCMPLRSRDGSIQGAIGLGIDASDRVKGDSELREKLELIERQSATIRALATPIIQVWDEVLCLPVIGTVDSARTADMMQGLLEAVVREQARYAIVDLTGVEVVDTSTADHLIQLFRAAKVLGVDGILCGIRPAVAQTVVALGLELGSVRTMRSLRDALKWCIARRSEARQHAAPKAGGKALTGLAHLEK